MRKARPIAVGVLLVGAGIGVPLLTVLVLFMLPPKFDSTAHVLPGVSSPSALAAEVKKIQSKEILTQTIANLNLAKTWREQLHLTELSSDQVYEQLRRDVKVTRSGESQVIGIRVRALQAVDAAAIANGIAVVYRDSTATAVAGAPDDAPRVRVLNWATPKYLPAGPSKPLVIGLSVAVGLGFVVGGVVFLTWSRRRDSRPSDAAAASKSELPPVLQTRSASKLVTRRGTLITLGLVFFFGGIVFCYLTVQAAIVTLILPPKYTITTRILPAATTPSALATEVEKIKSMSVLGQTITNLDLTTKWGEKFHEGALPVDLVYMLLLRNVDVSKSDDSGLIEIAVTADSATEAVATANDIAEVYQHSPLALRGPDPDRGVQIVKRAGAIPRDSRGRGFAVPIVLGVAGFLMVISGVVFLVRSSGTGSGSV